MIVTVDEVKKHLRIQHDEEDEYIESLIKQAQTAAEDYCRAAWTAEEAPETVRLAVLLMASHFYEYRDSSDRNAYNTMMHAFHALLYPNRAVDSMF